MDNQLVNLQPKEKYDFSKDLSFWTAFVVGGLAMFLGLLLMVATFSLGIFVVGLIIWLVWTGYIIFSKGKKGSLIIGLIIALFIVGLFIFLVPNAGLWQSSSGFDILH